MILMMDSKVHQLALLQRLNNIETPCFVFTDECCNTALVALRNGLLNSRIY